MAEVATVSSPESLRKKLVKGQTFEMLKVRGLTVVELDNPSHINQVQKKVKTWMLRDGDDL